MDESTYPVKLDSVFVNSYNLAISKMALHAFECSGTSQGTNTSQPVKITCKNKARTKDFTKVSCAT